MHWSMPLILKIGESKMSEGLTELNIRKLKTKLQKVVTECLLKGNLTELNGLGPRNGFDYALLEDESIYNFQIHALNKQIDRLEETLKD